MYKLVCLFFLLFTLPAKATEAEELALLLKQLKQLEYVIERAEQQADYPDSRYFFNYSALRADIQKVSEAITVYLTPERAQPRNIEAISGQYRQENP